MPTAQAAASEKTSTPAHTPLPYVSQAKWAKPLARPRVNFIPQQSYLSYNWVDRDPEMDLIHAAIADSGMTLEQIERETEKVGHRVSRYTLMAWVFGETRRPQNMTMSVVMSVLGYNKRWERAG
jgi:hypothetical protein